MTNATQAALLAANLTVGSIVEVLPGYSMDTRSRSIFDEIAGCEAEILTIYSNGDAEIFVKNMGEVAVFTGRLRRIR